MLSTNTDVVIAVMGMTGVGKSSFIRRMTGRRDIVVGNTLASATEEVTPYPFLYAGRRFILVDTPGFDDSRNPDDVIANRLLQWLRQSMNNGIRLNGIIYIHRIVEPRMRGSTLSNMNMFRRLCGPDCFANVVLATSFWNEVDPAEGARRERELWDKDQFWGSLIKKGSSVARIGLDEHADRRLLLKMAQNDQVTLQAQAEMQAGKQNSETSAAKIVSPEIDALKQDLAARFAQERKHAQNKLLKQEKEKQKILETQKQAFREEERQQQDVLEQVAAANAHFHNQQAKTEKTERRNAAKQEAELAQLRRACKEEADHRQALRQERREQYASHKCTKSLKHCKVVCNNCRQKIKHRKTQFYHCCHCKRDDFDLCLGCGPACLNCDHPPMKLCGGY